MKRRALAALLWLGIAAYLLFKLAITSARGLKRRAEVGAAKPNSGAAEVVQWCCRALLRPSRADALRNVPDYCARLIHTEIRGVLMFMPDEISNASSVELADRAEMPVLKVPFPGCNGICRKRCTTASSYRLGKYWRFRSRKSWPGSGTGRERALTWS